MLTKLTKKQLDLIPVYRDKWIKIGSGTGKTDEKRVRDIITRVYHVSDFDKPALIFLCGSPLACLISSSILQEKNSVWNLGKRQISNQISDQVSDQVHVQIRNQVWDQVWHQVWNSVLRQVRNGIWDELWRNHAY